MTHHKKITKIIEKIGQEMHLKKYLYPTIALNLLDAHDHKLVDLDKFLSFEYTDITHDVDILLQWDRTLHECLDKHRMLRSSPDVKEEIIKKKKYAIVLVCGTDACHIIGDGLRLTNDVEGSWATYEFDTQAELDAFCSGVDACDGWLETTLLPKADWGLLPEDEANAEQ